MPYQETHTIVIGPITLPLGVSGTGGQQSVSVTGVTESSRADTATLLHDAFAQLMTAATAEGVGTPVFQ